MHALLSIYPSRHSSLHSFFLSSTSKKCNKHKSMSAVCSCCLPLLAVQPTNNVFKMVHLCMRFVPNVFFSKSESDYTQSNNKPFLLSFFNRCTVSKVSHEIKLSGRPCVLNLEFQPAWHKTLTCRERNYCSNDQRDSGDSASVSFC